MAAQPFKPRLPSDPAADERATQESLDIERATSSQAADSAAIRARADALGRCSCVSYLHATLATGAPSTLAAAGARITTVAATITVELDPPVESPYSVRVDDQASASDLVYRVDNALARSLTLRATDLAGAAVDLSVGDRAFTLALYRLLPETF